MHMCLNKEKKKRERKRVSLGVLTICICVLLTQRTIGNLSSLIWFSNVENELILSSDPTTEIV